MRCYLILSDRLKYQVWATYFTRFPSELVGTKNRAKKWNIYDIYGLRLIRWTETRLQIKRYYIKRYNQPPDVSHFNWCPSALAENVKLAS